MARIASKRTLTKTRRHLRDIDQVKQDLLNPRSLQLYKETKLSEDLPGLGKHYCTECAKWFETETSLTSHNKGKPHRRRVKALINPYTHEEAAIAGGHTPRIDNGPSKPKAQDMEIEMS